MSEGQGDGGLECEGPEGDGGLESTLETNTGGSVEECSAEDQGDEPVPIAHLLGMARPDIGMSTTSVRTPQPTSSSASQTYNRGMENTNHWLSMHYNNFIYTDIDEASQRTSVTVSILFHVF